MPLMHQWHAASGALAACCTYTALGTPFCAPVCWLTSLKPTCPAASCTPAPAAQCAHQHACLCLQEEVEQKRRKLQRLQRTFATKQAQADDIGQDCQREREDLLDDIRLLTHQIKLKDLLIASYIPPHHQQRIMQHCTWDDVQQAWHIDQLSLAGNAVQGQRSREAAQEEAGNAGVHGASTHRPAAQARSQQQQVFLSYAALSKGKPSNRPASSHRNSRPSTGRQSASSAKQVDVLNSQIAQMSKYNAKPAFPRARGLISARRPNSRSANI